MKSRLGQKTVFSSEQEKELADLLMDLSKRGFGLTRLDVRRLAYQFAKKKNIEGFSEETKLAGYDWFQAFMNRHRGLSVRKVENLSLYRAANII